MNSVAIKGEGVSLDSSLRGKYIRLAGTGRADDIYLATFQRRQTTTPTYSAIST